jgi:hypothetical protein
MRKDTGGGPIQGKPPPVPATSAICLAASQRNALSLEAVSKMPFWQFDLSETLEFCTAEAF